MNHILILDCYVFLPQYQIWLVFNSVKDITVAYEDRKKTLFTRPISKNVKDGVVFLILCQEAC